VSIAPVSDIGALPNVTPVSYGPGGTGGNGGSALGGAIANDGGSLFICSASITKNTATGGNGGNGGLLNGNGGNGGDALGGGIFRRIGSPISLNNVCYSSNSVIKGIHGLANGTGANGTDGAANGPNYWQV